MIEAQQAAVRDAQGAHELQGGAGHGEAEVFDPAPHRPTKRALTVSVGIGLVALAALLAVGIIPRITHRNEMADAEQTAAAQTPKVRVARAERSAASTGLELPGSMQALQEADDLRAAQRTLAYVRSWKVDIGARVEEGGRSWPSWRSRTSIRS